ncbi:tape measure domain [Sphingobacterium spiritivorum]|uniref:Tape measure domain n=1 Tax=Sphingobacterium spiritivorum TaxID=258 RepID=A0A380CQE0_SPHSI|nr:tape measure protein [Sphingobacterium spiritivorum]SUJ26551.1 tape measure domain [Sphingobacterium spiritivorum]
MSDLQLDIDFLINNPAIRDAVRRARLDIGGLADQSQRDADRMERAFKRLSITIAGIFSASQAKDFVMQLINVRGEYQQMEIAFTTILQSKAKADALMSDVVRLAAKTPFGLKDAGQGAKQLLAYGTASELVVDTLTMLGNVASGVSAPLNDIVYLYGTLQASGRVTQMDINQFAGRGIPIYQALADVMGKNTSEIKDLVAAGKVGFPEIQAAFEKMTGAGGQFYNLMEAQSKSLTGQISNLEDAWDQMLNEIGKENEDILSGGIELVASLVEHYQTIIDVLKVLIVTYGVYRAAIIANTLATSGMTVVELLHYGALVLAEKAQKLLNLTTMANPYVAAATALGFLITALVVFSEKTDVAVKSMENINSIRETAIKTTIEQKQKLQDLIKVANNETLSLNEREAALKKINKVSPEFLGSLTLAKLKTEEGRKAIEEYNRSIDLMAMKQASFDKRVELQKQKVELLSGSAEEKIGHWDRIKANFRTGKAGKFNEQEYEKVRKQQAEDFDKQLKDIDAYEANEIAKYNAKKPKELKTEVKRTVAVIDEEIKARKEAQANVSTKAEYAKIQLEINKLEAEKAAITGQVNKAERKQGEDRLDFLQKLADKEAEVKRKGLSSDEAEVKRIQKEYDDLRKNADKLKLGSGVKERINNAENTEVGFLRYEQQTDALKTAMEKQKQLYTDFEEYKKTFGAEKANERYSQQIDIEKTYLNYLENLYKEFEGKKNLTGGEEERKKLLAKDIDDAKLLIQQNRDKEFAEAYEAAKTYQQKELELRNEYARQIDILLKEQNGAISAEQRANLERNRDEAIEAAKAEALAKTDAYKRAAEDIFDLTRQQVKSEIKVLKSLLADQSISDEVKKQIQANLSKLEITLKIGVDQANLDSLRFRLQALKDQLNARDSAGNSILSPRETKRILKDIAEISAEIEKITTNGKLNNKFSQGLKNNFDYLKESSAVMADGISNDLSALSNDFNEISQALGGVDTQAGYVTATIGQLVKVGSDAAGAFASFASGDIVGGITKTISAVTGLFSIGKQVKEMNAAARKEVEDFYANAIAGERAYQDLLKQRALQTIRDNKTNLNAIGAELKLRQSQLSEWKKESDEIMSKLSGMSFIASETYKHGTWFRKAKVIKTYDSLSGMDFEQLSQLLAQGKLEGDAKALVERLKELEQKGYDASQAMADLADEVNQLFTGTTADGLTDSLLSLFREGKTGFADMAEFFESTMKDAALNIFKNKVLADAMQTFYKDFATASKDGLTDDKIANLRSLFDSLMADANKQFDALKAVTGLDLGKAEGNTQSKGTLTDAVKGMTSDQAGIIAGQFSGQRLATLEGNSIMRQHHETAMQQLAQAKQNGLMLVKIEDNTRRNADSAEQYLPYLKEIANKMNNNNALRATGN